MKAFTATIDIGAPPTEVWAILTDLGSYHEWNPLFVEAAGDVAVGQRIKLTSRHPANGRLMTVKPRITVVEPGTELRWTSSLPGVISGEHSFMLSATDGGTRLVQAETFRGLLARFSGKTFANAGDSFRALNEALKESAEARANRPTRPEA
ncbi:MAG: SRPBCC family protein [Streptosporangiaceae bacterium]